MPTVEQVDQTQQIISANAQDEGADSNSNRTGKADVPGDDSDVEAHAESTQAVKVQTIDRPYTIFTGPQKAVLVLTATLGGMFSPFTANIYLPAIDSISVALGVTVSKVNLTITTYMICQAVAPSFISAIADSRGRRPAYVICFLVYMLANLGLGLNNTYAGLITLRCLQACGSAPLATLGQGTIADIITSAERGKYIAITSIASILGPAIAPIAGGLLAENLGWHSIFWFLLIFSAVYVVPLVLFFPETSRKIVGDGSIKPPKWNSCLMDRFRHRGKDHVENYGTREEAIRKAGPKRRFGFLASLSVIADPETAMILVVIGIVYAAFYAISTSLTVQFGRIYNLNSSIQGLLFLPQAGGTLFAAMFNSKVVDYQYQRYARKTGMTADKSKQINVLETPLPIERARLELVIPLLSFASACMIAYGWLLEAQVSIAGPLVMLVVNGFTTLSGFSMLSVLVIDLHRSRSATASAANNLVRCLLGAAASAVVNPMIDGIGNGWTFTIWGLLCLIFPIPLLLVCIKHGPSLRARRCEKERQRVTPATTVQKA